MRTFRTTYILSAIIAFLILSSCSKPSEVHSRKEMERIMYDVYIAEAMIDNDYSNFNTPEKKEALINEVFTKHRTSQARWDTSLSWYSDRVEIYLKMNDSVRARLKRNQTQVESQLNRQLAMEQSVTDRTGLSSSIPLNYSFDEVNPKNGFRFRLDSNRIKELPDSLELSFSFDVLGVSAYAKPNLITQLILEYKDTTIINLDSISENIHYSFPIERYIEEDTLNSILGFIRLQDTLRLYRNIHLKDIKLGNSYSIRIGSEELELPERPTKNFIREETLKEVDS